MNFSSKAQTLKCLEGQLASTAILPQYCFSVLEWQNDALLVVNSFQEKNWATNKLIVRSSSAEEDTDRESLAGHFKSVLNVNGKNALSKAIESVIASFKNHNPEDRIFIQPMLESVGVSGVVFTYDPSTKSPYYVVNYSTNDDTEAITSGTTNDSVFYISKNSALSSNELPNWLVELIKLCIELEDKFNNKALDIEFAVNKQGALYLFQVRPLILELNDAITDQQHHQLLQRVENTVRRIVKPHPYLNGKRSVLGVMPDWNPAEIIGIRPKPLALSLYKELITDSIWAYQRDNYGYKQLRSFPLLVNLSGLPYIDVRVSFNSFIPAGISADLSEKLVNFYIEKLETRPDKHDKIEFDIIFSCFTFDLEPRLTELRRCGFDDNELQVLILSLKALTNKIINPNGLWVEDKAKIDKLPARRIDIINSKLTKVEKVVWLLEDCKRYGTLPFAGLARAAFIAVQLLKSMVADKILSQADYDNYLGSLEIVSSVMSKDQQRMSFSAFLKKYGHLRPGTYDILSPRYDQAPEKYFDQNAFRVKTGQTNDSTRFSLSNKQSERLEARLNESGIEHDVKSLFHFIKGAIEGREHAKFVFTQSLSDAIAIIEKTAIDIGITKEEIAYMDIATIYKANSSTDNIEELIKKSVAVGKKLYSDAKSLILPPLIVEPSDVYQFKMPEGEPNFITLGKATAETIKQLDNTECLAGKIVFIPSADPGYDWLFSYDIAGLITKYGGANSHMAIRSGEQRIPSVIGAGEIFYEKWVKAKIIELDAGNRKVVILK